MQLSGTAIPSHLTFTWPRLERSFEGVWRDGASNDIICRLFVLWRGEISCLEF